MKRKFFLLAALVAMLSLFTVTASAEAGYVKNREDFYHIYLAPGQARTIELDINTGDNHGGYSWEVYRTSLSGGETQAELKTLAAKLITERNGCVDKSNSDGWTYNGSAGLNLSYVASADALGTGTYLLAAYAFQRDGGKIPYYDSMTAIAIHVVPNEIPITGVEVYWCDANGENLSKIEPGSAMVVPFGNSSFSYTYYITFRKIPYNATAEIAAFQTSTIQFGNGGGSQLTGGFVGPGLHGVGRQFCGEGTSQILVNPCNGGDYITLEGPKVLTPCEPTDTEVIFQYPSCTADGLQGYVCKGYPMKCGTVYQSEVYQKANHRLRDPEWAKYEVLEEPTATQTGLALGSCQECGQWDVEAWIPAIFTDTASDQYYCDAVDYCYENGLVKGMTETTFGPHESITRGQVVTLLHRLAGEPKTQAQNPFGDVLTGAYYTQAIIWAAEAGIAKGITETGFQPDTPVTRQQLATFMYRFAEVMEQDTQDRADLAIFTDRGEISDYAADSVGWAVAKGLINGMTPDTMCPMANAQRAQFVTILYRFIQAYPEVYTPSAN